MPSCLETGDSPSNIHRVQHCSMINKFIESPTMAPPDPYPSPPPSPAQIKADPILRNALRYTLSAKEYKTLHQYLISRSPPAVRKRALQPSKYAALIQAKDDYNGAAIRASLRVFLATQTSLKLWELIKGTLFAREKPRRYVNWLAILFNC